MRVLHASQISLTSSDITGLTYFATGTDAANLTGTVAAARLPARTGDVTSSAGSAVMTIATSAVTYAKLQNASAGNVLLGRAVGTSGVYAEIALGASEIMGRGSTGNLAPIVLGTNLSMSGTTLNATGGGGSGTVTTVSVTTANGVSGSVATATSTPAITLTLGAITPTSVAASGTVTGSNLSGTNTGDQTITLTGNVTGSGTGSFATTIPAGTVTLAMQANMATGSLVYRKTAASGVPEVNTLATLKTDLGLTGTNSGDQTITLTGNVTGSGTGSFATTIAANAVTLGMQAQVATATIRGRVTASTGNLEDLTGTQATTLLDVVTSALKGLAPASGGGTANFLRADATWAAPPSGAYTVVSRSGANTETATSGEVVVLATAAVDQTITLPTAVGNTAKYTVKKTAAGGIVTIATTSSQTIDGATTLAFGNRYDAYTVISDNANWWII